MTSRGHKNYVAVKNQFNKVASGSKSVLICVLIDVLQTLVDPVRGALEK